MERLEFQDYCGLSMISADEKRRECEDLSKLTYTLERNCKIWTKVNSLEHILDSKIIFQTDFILVHQRKSLGLRSRLGDESDG